MTKATKYDSKRFIAEWKAKGEAVRKANEERVVTLTLNALEVDDLLGALAIESVRLAGRSESDWIAKRYDEIREKIRRQRRITW